MKKINSISFKKAMGKFVTGVTVISINSNNIYVGKTVNSFASLSLNPPLVLFSLDKKSFSLTKFKKSKFIGINFLSNKQKNLSTHFANKKNWGSTKFFLSKNNVPMIEKSIVNLNCQNIKTMPSGDHIIFICKVSELHINKSLKPLIYLKNKYV